MRRWVVFLTVITLLALSLAMAWLASDWPHWCRLCSWCDGQGLL